MLVNNKVVKCKALNDVLENEFKDISIYDSKEMFSDAVDEFIQINVEMLAYEQADKNWNDKVSIYEVISNVDEFRDTVHDFVNKSWDGFVESTVILNFLTKTCVANLLKENLMNNSRLYTDISKEELQSKVQLILESSMLNEELKGYNKDISECETLGEIDDILQSAREYYLNLEINEWSWD